jgi:hypothetical protein
LQAREQQIETAAAYIQALRDYWLARGDAAQLVSGRLPGSSPGAGASIRGQAGQKQTEGH